MSLVGGEDVRTPLRAFRVVFRIPQLIISRGPVLTNPTIYADRPLPGAARVRHRSRSGMRLHFVHDDPQVPVHDPLLEDARQEVGDQPIGVRLEKRQLVRQRAPDRVRWSPPCCSARNLRSSAQRLERTAKSSMERTRWRGARVRFPCRL